MFEALSDILAASAKIIILIEVTEEKGGKRGGEGR